MDQPDEQAELHERVAALERQLEQLQSELGRATNRDLPLLKGTIRSIMAADIGTVDEFPAAGRAFGQRVDAHGERLDRLEARLDIVTEQSDASTKGEKVAAVLAFAQNKADESGKVAVTPAEIRGSTGVSRRYAYDLVDAIASDVDGAHVREARDVQTASGTERKGKALLVDCERVHELTEAVNSFTTGGGESGGS